MAGFCLLPAVFLRTGTLLRADCRTVRPASARQSVRRCGTCRLSASRCTVGKESRLNGRIHFAAANRTCPSRGRLTGIPACFFDGDGGNKLPQPARRCCRADAGPRHPCRIQLYAPARRGVGLQPAELPKAEKTRIRRIICTMRRLVSAKRTVKPKRQAAERGGAGAFAFHRAASARADCPSRLPAVLKKSRLPNFCRLSDGAGCRKESGAPYPCGRLRAAACRGLSLNRQGVRGLRA